MNWKAFAVISFAVSTGMLSGCKTAENTTADAAPVSAARTKTPSRPVPAWVAPASPYRPAETIITDLVHTKLRVSFDWPKQHLIGEATLTCRPYFYPQNTLVLDARGFEIKNVALGSGKKLNHSYDGQKLIITLDKSYNRTENYEVVIDYVAKPNELEAGGSAAITSDKGLYFINPLGEDKNKPRQIWTQGETQASSAWFPTIDAPNQKMTQEIYITIEDNFKTLSNGSLIYSRQRPNGMRTDYWKQELPHAPYLAMMAIGEFAVVHDTWKAKDVDYYVEPKYKNSAKAIFGNTPEMLSFFSKKLGVEYPWSKYAQVVVRDYVSGAMENTSATLFGEFVQMDRRELLDRNWDDIISHELFHQWFGDLVTTESWSNLPLNESFASYGEYLWAEHKLGKDEADMGLKDDLGSYLQESVRKRVPLIRYHYEKQEDMFDRHSYQKGARVLHLLRNQVGDEAFFAALQKYLTDNKFKSVEIANLRLAFEEVTGQDLMWFFDQWFLKPGHPELRADQTFADGKLTLRIFQHQDTVYSPLYNLPLKVAIWTNGKKTEHDITVSRFRNTFEFPTAAKPDLVVIDPDGLLLGVLDHQKSETEYIYQYYHADRFIPKAMALEQLLDKVEKPEVQKVFQDALKDKFWRIREIAVYAFNPTRFMQDKTEQGQPKFSDPKYAPIKQAIRQVALSDSKTVVRAEALATLSSYRSDEFTDVFTKALLDSSYSVAAAGIGGLNPNPKGDEFLPAVNRLDNTENASVVAALSAFYATHGTIDQYSWFQKQISVQPDRNLPGLVSTFAVYLYKLPEEKRKAGIALLADLARNHKNADVRLGSFKALTIVGEETGVKDILNELKLKETDPDLKAIYKNLP